MKYVGRVSHPSEFYKTDKYDESPMSLKRRMFEQGVLPVMTYTKQGIHYM